MASDSKTSLLKGAERLLASVQSYNGDRSSRLALVKQLELLRLEIEDPMDSMITEWEHVSPAFRSYELEISQHAYHELRISLAYQLRRML